MELSVKRRRVLATILVLCDIFFVVTGFGFTRQRSVSQDIGSLAVNIMYDFDDVTELPARYSTLRKYVSDSAWNELDLDGEFRAINTYFKFNTKSSEVKVLLRDDGIVTYRLLNPYIRAEDIWVFAYDINRGLIDDVSEYKMVSVRRGREGIW